MVVTWYCCWVPLQVVKETEQAAQQVEKEAAKEGGGAEATAPAVKVEVTTEPEAEGKKEEEKAPVEEGSWSLSHYLKKKIGPG